MFFRLLTLEIRALARNIQALLVPMVFLFVFVVLFPLALTSQQQQLASMAAGICWLAVLFSLILHIDRIFRDDIEQGILEQWLAGGISIVWFVQARILAYWLLTGIPMVFASFAVALLFSLPSSGFVALFSSLAFGTLILISLGTFIASLTLSGHQGAMLISVLLIPLLVPVIVFGVESVKLAVDAEGSIGMILVLPGLALINLVLAPWLTMIALQNLIE